LVYTTREVRLTFILLSNSPRLHSIQAREITMKIKEQHNYYYYGCSMGFLVSTNVRMVFNLFKIDCHNNDCDDNAAIAVGGPSFSRIIQRAHRPW